MKVKIISANSAKSLEQKVNEFIERKDITVLKIHFSSSFNGVYALIEYEEK